MSNSIHRRLKSIEKKAGQGDKIVTLEFGDGTSFTLTADALTRIIKAVQGTYLKPVPVGDIEEREEY